MRRTVGKILRIAAVLAAVLVLVIVGTILFFLFDKPHVKRILEDQLAKRTGITVHASRLDYSLFPFHLTAETAEIGLENDVQKIDLTVARLEAKGDFWRLVRGLKPALDSIEVDGAAFTFRQKAPPKKPLDYEAIVLKTAETLAWAGRISITRARLAASLLDWEASLEGADIILEPGSEKGKWTYSLHSSGIELKDKDKALRLSSRLTSSGDLQLASSLSLEVSLALAAPRFTVDGVEGSPAAISIESAGVFGLAARELAVSRLKVSIPEFVDFEGTAEGKLSRELSLKAGGTAKLGRLENATALLRPRLPPKLREARLRGRAVLSGNYSLQRSAGQSAESLEASLVFEDLELDHVLNGSPLHVRAAGWVKASGPSRDPQLSADIRSSLGRAALGKLRVGGTDIHVVVSGTKEAAKIERLEAALKDLSFDGGAGPSLALDKAAVEANGNLILSQDPIAFASLDARFKAALQDLFLAVAADKGFPFNHVTLKGKARLDLSGKTAALDSLQVELPGFPPLSVSGQYTQSRPSAARARLETRGLDLPSVRKLASPFIPENLAGWDLSGTADLSFELKRPTSSGAGWGFSGTLTLAQVSLNDPDFTVASEGMSPALKVEGEYTPPLGLSFKSELDLSQGESLWKAVYIPWSKHPLRLTAAGRYDPGKDLLDGLAVRFILPTIGEAGLAGSVAIRPLLSFELRSDARLSLGPLYSLYAQAGVSAGQRMALEGMVSTVLDIKRNGAGISVTGKVTLADANVERPLTKTVLHDVDAEVPVHFELGQASPASPETPLNLDQAGSLKIGQFRNAWLTLDSLDIPLRAGANAFSIEPFTAALYGGRVELGRTVFRLDLQAGSIQGAGSLAVHGLDISRLPVRSPRFQLTGALEADFPRFDISRREIAVSGRGEASVFGGKVVLRDLAVSEPFSPGRSISLNLDLVDLDLKKLTDEVPFGEVTGVIRGEVRDLVITYGQPERFELRLESVPRKGVPQTFSLKAVDDLTVLSSGGEATAGTSRFWMRFVRGFHYQRLGIVSTLRNDTFTLNGTIHEGGVEYLVKRSPLFGISVVNRLPRNVIGFKEMMSRLKRIGQSENIPAKKEERK